MVRENPARLLYKIQQLQAALNTVNSKANSTNSQAVAALSRVIERAEQLTYFANNNGQSDSFVSTGSGSNVGLMNLVTSTGAVQWVANSNVAFANNDRLTIVYSVVNRSNLTVQTGSGSGILYLNLSQNWASSNVALKVGDQVYVDSSNAIISSLPVDSNTVIVSTSNIVGGLATGVLKIRKILANLNVTVTNVYTSISNTTERGHIYVTPGIVGGLVSNTIIITKASPNTHYAVKNTDVGRTVTANSGNVNINDSVFNPGDTIYIHNNNTSAYLVVSQNSGVTIYRTNTGVAGGIANTGSFNVAPKGYVTLICTAANTFVASGMGIL